MRTPNYLSPSAIMQFKKNRDEYYMRYLAENRPPKIPQTEPMAAGSAFDAYAKSYIHEALHGKPEPGSQFDTETILTQQVEKQNLPWARYHGKRIFDMYQSSGALATLMKELNNAKNIKMEFQIEGNVVYEKELEGIPLLGKPDLRFDSAGGNVVIFDWKVNGYCSSRMTSPSRGYIRCRDGWKESVMKHSRSHMETHKDCVLVSRNGMGVNSAVKLEDVNSDWATQLAIYAWLLGVPVGEEFVACIEQLCGYPGTDGYMYIRIATHRAVISKLFQVQLFGEVAKMWRQILRGPEFIYEDLGMNRSESKRKCEELDQMYLAYKNETPFDKWFTKTHRI